jgi:glutathione S-transferase
MKLIIGNKTVSSWSMRPWILMKHFELPFEEVLIKLDMPSTAEEIKKYSPSGKVPALDDEGMLIWESVAIMEYLNEKYPNKIMYPADLKQRAFARSLVMEMHAGYTDLREHLSFNAKKRHENFDLTAALNDINRIKSMFSTQLKKFAGPFLFGDFSIVDAMYAPVVGRFITYGVPVDGLVKDYVETMMGLPAMKAWYEGAEEEEFEAIFHK